MAPYSLYVGLLTLITSNSVFCHPVPPRKQGFSIQQTVRALPQSGPRHLARLYSKFKAETPSDVITALTNENVAATPEAYDSRYLCPVTIGGQTLNLDFDTGSSDLWVFSTELSGSQDSGHTLYDSSLSPTAKPMDGYTWSIHYADSSSASGNVYSDSISIDNVTVTSQAIELATNVSSQFEDDPSVDGLFGLAFLSLNSIQPQQQNDFVTNAYEQNVIPQQIFTADLQKGGPGSFDFGFIDSSKYTGQINYVSVDNSSGFWGLTTSGYQVGSNSFNYTPSKAIVDTGTTLMAMDSTLVSNYWSAVSGATYDSNQGGYTFPCDAELPDLQIGVGEYSATVPGSFLNFAPVDGATCFGGLQGNTNIGFSILGDVFIKSQFVVFDADNLQIGFAAKDLSGTASVTSITQNSTAVSAITSDIPTAAPTTYYSGTTLTISMPTYTTVITIPALSAIGSDTPTGITSDLPTGVTSNLPTGITSDLPTGVTSDLPTGVTSDLPTGITSDLPTAAATTYYNGTTLSISVPSYSTIITVPTVTAASATTLAETGTATLQYTLVTSTPYDDGLYHTTYYKSATITADAATSTSTSEATTDALLTSILSTTATNEVTATDASSTPSTSDTTTPAAIDASTTTPASEIVTTITVSALDTQITLTVTSSPAALPSAADSSTIPTDTLASTTVSASEIASAASAASSAASTTSELIGEATASVVTSTSTTAADGVSTALTPSYPTLQPTSTGSSTTTSNPTAPFSAASYAPSNFAYSTIPDVKHNNANGVGGSAQPVQKRGMFKIF